MRTIEGDPLSNPVGRLVRALAPAPHVLHANPDAIAVLCCAVKGEQLTRECFGEDVGWISSSQSSTTLVRRVAEVTRRGDVRLVLLAKHGLVTWGETPEECQARVMEAREQATEFVATRAWGLRFGGPALVSLDVERRTELLARLLPLLRTTLSHEQPQVLELDTSDEVLEFVCSRDAPVLAQAGPLLFEAIRHTKRVPLWVDFDPRHDDDAALAARIRSGAERYRRRERTEQRLNGTDAAARVVLIAGTGMVTAGSTAANARAARDLYLRTIAVIGSITGIDRLAPLTTWEASAAERPQPHLVGAG